MTERICATTGCWTYTRGDAKYCLACQLDNKIPQPPLNRMGRPSAIVEHIAQCELALEECERCERALMMVSNEEAHARLDQVWALLEKKRERHPR
jgi:hypothetical protein